MCFVYKNPVYLVSLLVIFPIDTVHTLYNQPTCYIWPLSFCFSLEEHPKAEVLYREEEEEENFRFLLMEMILLDYILVPSGIIVMLAYHLWLLYRILKHPNRTVIGINAVNRRFWVWAMMEETSKNGVLAVQTLRNNIMASTLLASTAIMLSSLIAVLMTSGGLDKSELLVFGDRSQLGFSVKFFSILVCFLVAFLLNVQSIRYYSHASMLINVPYKKMSSDQHYQDITAEYVARTVNRGSYFWSLGLRAFYFSFPLFLWIFGPIPMFFSCSGLVLMLYFLDVTLELGWNVSISAADDYQKDEEIGIRGT